MLSVGVLCMTSGDLRAPYAALVAMGTMLLLTGAYL